MPLHALADLSNLTDPSTARTALGLGTADSPTFASVTTTGSVRVGANQYLGGPDADSGFFVNDGRTFDWIRDGVLQARFGAQCTFRDSLSLGTTPASPTVFLYHGGSSILEQRNGDGANAAQTFRLYNTFSGSTNFERLNFRWDASSGTPVAKIGTEKGSGGGVARDLVLETDGTERFRVTAAGQVRIVTGASGASGAGTVRFGGGIINTIESWGGTANGAFYVYSEGTIRMLIGGSSGTVIYQSFYPDNTTRTLGLSTNRWGTLYNTGVNSTGTIETTGSIKASQPIIFPSYTVAQLQALTISAYTGGMAYCTDEADGATMVFSDGTNWRRVQDRAIISVAP